MLAGLALLIFVVGALQLAGVLVISGIAGGLLMVFFLLFILPMTGLLMLKGAWLWFMEQWHKRRR